VLAADADDVVDAVARAEAVRKVRDLPDFPPIAAAFKRINNILKQAHEKAFKTAADFDNSIATEEERTLRAKAELLAPRFNAARENRDYADALIQLSTLRESVDTFFDKVMVMVDDDRLRANRLALLQSLLRSFSTIADFSEIVTEGKGS